MLRRNSKSLVLACAALGLLCSAWAGNIGVAPKARLKVTPSAYLEHVRYLASDELEGRGTGTPGIDRAADYIAEQFKAFGLKPAGVDDTWFQPFEARIGKRLADEKARLEVEGLDRNWKVREDWIPFPFTVMESVEGPLAFAGYGIQAARYDYDDYDGFDAEGKILLVLRYEPKAEDSDAEFGGTTSSRYALFTRKARTAKRHGAKALLIVNPTNRDADSDDLFEFTTFMSRQTYQLPMAHISRDMANALLAKAGMPNVETLTQKLDQERKSRSQDMGLTVRLDPGVEPNALPARNVLGLLPGDGSTDETIVVGAHYDHLGKQAPFRGEARTPQIHNGADDNASGTAGLIELARALAGGPKPRRNILFIAFSAEELGLIGSRHYVDNPTVPLENTKAMLNLDMIGRLSQDKFAIIGTGSAVEFEEMAAAAAETVDLKYAGSAGMSGGSDHAPFIRQEIPALFLFTGVHKEYHMPEDDWNLIDAEGATRVIELAHDLVWRMANLESGPTFTEPPRRGRPGDEDISPAIEEAEARAQGEEGGDEPGGEAGGGDAGGTPSRDALRVRLGVIPDMVGDDKVGMLIDAVLEGGPAKAAGIQDGDRILQIGGEEIRDIYGYMRALQQFKPGDEAEIIVERSGERKTLKVKFDAAQARPDRR